MLYYIIFIALAWVVYLTATIAKVDKQNKRIIGLLEDLQMRAIDKEFLNK